jgi:hypothetical protein
MKISEAVRYTVRHRGLVLQWIAVLGPPAAWSIQFLAAYNIADSVSCDPGSFRFLMAGGAKPVIAAVSGACLLLAVGTTLLSVRCHRRLRRSDVTTGHRARWLAVVGIIVGVLFSVMIANSYAPIAILSPACHQSQ